MAAGSGAGAVLAERCGGEGVARTGRLKQTRLSQNGHGDWADILWGKSYGPGRGFGAQTRPPGGPQRSENSQTPKMTKSRKSENQNVNGPLSMVMGSSPGGKGSRLPWGGPQELREGVQSTESFASEERMCHAISLQTVVSFDHQ